MNPSIRFFILTFFGLIAYYININLQLFCELEEFCNGGDSYEKEKLYWCQVLQNK